MNILLLSPYPERLLPTLMVHGDTVTCAIGAPAENEMLRHAYADLRDRRSVDFDRIICYGYRHLIGAKTLARLPRMINLHISLLPWNRGADPNFWSWFDDTPKGVSIHEIDAGVDTGAVLAQREIDPTRELFVSEAGSLASTYEGLHIAAAYLLYDHWPAIRDGSMPGTPQSPGGTSHRRADRDAVWHLFPAGWDTPVAEVERIGREYRACQTTRAASPAPTATA